MILVHVTKVIWFCGGHRLCADNLFERATGPMLGVLPFGGSKAVNALSLKTDVGPLQLVVSATLPETVTSFGSLRVTNLQLSSPTADPTKIRPRAAIAS